MLGVYLMVVYANTVRLRPKNKHARHREMVGELCTDSCARTVQTALDHADLRIAYCPRMSGGLVGYAWYISLPCAMQLYDIDIGVLSVILLHK